MSLQVQLDKFEGPLSLLLFLIKKNELDIYDIPIHDITKQYLSYIQIMKELNLEVAGEFVAMAATLIYIKSRMLVPQYNEDGEVVQEDPRKELVQKLLEYQKFQSAAKQLGKRSMLGKDIWIRGAKEDFNEAELAGEIILDDKGLFALIGAFRDLIKNAKPETFHDVHAKGLSISARMISMQDKFVLGGRIEVRELLQEGYTKTDLIITFLSVLELARLQYIRIFQTEPYAPLYLETIRVVDRGIVTQVQEFDSADAEQTVQSLLAQAETDQAEGHGLQEAEIDIASLDGDAEIQAVESGELV